MYNKNESEYTPSNTNSTGCNSHNSDRNYTTPKNFCPNCELKLEVSQMTPEYLAVLATHLSPEDKTASDSLYQSRIAECNKCDALKDKIMCSWNGCYIVLRAYSKDAYCPYPKNDKWNLTPKES